MYDVTLTNANHLGGGHLARYNFCSFCIIPLPPSFLLFQMTDNIQQILHAAAAAAVMNERNEYFWVCTDTYLRG